MMSVLLTIFIALILPIVLFCYFYRPNISTLKGKLSNGWSLGEQGHVHLSNDVKDMLSAHRDEWKVDSSNYGNYARICGYSNDHSMQQPTEAPCYIETSFIKLGLTIISKWKFPLSPSALIHVKQTMKVHADLNLISTPCFYLSCNVIDIRQVEKGFELDIGCYGYQLPKKTLIWEGVMTLLSRNKETQKRNKDAPARKQKELSQAEDFEWIETQFSVPKNIGWDYAKVSGDYNLHHLNPWTAHLVGYPRAMAHGMWTLSRTLALLQQDTDINLFKTYPVSVATQFKRPLFIPNEASVKYHKSSKHIKFEVWAKTPLSLNMVGEISWN